KFWGNPCGSGVIGGLVGYGRRNRPQFVSVVFLWGAADDHADKWMCIRIYANLKVIAGRFERSFADVTGLLFAWYLVGKVDLERQNFLIHILAPRKNTGCNTSVVGR